MVCVAVVLLKSCQGHQGRRLDLRSNFVSVMSFQTFQLDLQPKGEAARLAEAYFGRERVISIAECAYMKNGDKVT